jgi:cytochrome o ubiquinol oxidase subunit 3
MSTAGATAAGAAAGSSRARAGDRTRSRGAEGSHGGRNGDSARQAHAAHEAAKRIVVGYGFWIFLISDIIMFAAFFATYAVLTNSTAGGPSGPELFDIRNVAIETACLLLSSFSCGLAGIGAHQRNNALYYGGMAVTFVLGAGFLALELTEFAHMIAEGAGPSRSAFLSAFFALIGCHGLHVTAGMLWLLTMMAQVFAKGYRDDIMRRLLCFSLFWHTLDIIWVGLFSLVYLVGVAQ